HTFTQRDSRPDHSPQLRHGASGNWPAGCFSTNRPKHKVQKFMRKNCITQLLLLLSCMLALSACMQTDQPANDNFEALVHAQADASNHLANNIPIPDATGLFTTVSTSGSIDLNNEFFQNLGTNGRRCVSCHLPTAGWSITPPQLQAVFDITNGG